MRPVPRRLTLLLTALLVIAAGLLVRTIGSGAWADHAGDALYAVLVYLLLTALAPGARPVPAAALGAALCWGIELFQLTGIPLRLGQSWPPVRLLLGTTFGAVDLLAYAAGIGAALAADRITAALWALSRQHSGPGRTSRLKS